MRPAVLMITVCTVILDLLQRPVQRPVRVQLRQPQWPPHQGLHLQTHIKQLCLSELKDLQIQTR